MDCKIIIVILSAVAYQANSVEIYSESYGEVLTVKSKFECKGLYNQKPYFNERFALLYEFNQTSTSEEGNLAEVVLYGNVKQSKKATIDTRGVWTFYNTGEESKFDSIGFITFEDLKVFNDQAEINGTVARYQNSIRVKPDNSFEYGINGILDLSCKRINLL